MPQFVPAGTGSVVAVHTGPPVLQAMRDCRQASGGVQSWPWTQATQTPAGSHTMPVPQLAPVPSGTPVSTHCEVPVRQLVSQRVQTPSGVQVVPATQPTHWPAPSHT